MPTPSKLRSPEDDQLEVSGLLDGMYDSLPILVPITERAVGCAAALGALFVSAPLGAARAGLDRPDLACVGGLATENGTRGLFAGDLRHWAGDLLQTLVAVGKSTRNWTSSADDRANAIRPATLSSRRGDSFRRHCASAAPVGGRASPAPGRRR